MGWKMCVIECFFILKVGTRLDEHFSLQFLSHLDARKKIVLVRPSVRFSLSCFFISF